MYGKKGRKKEKQRKEEGALVCESGPITFDERNVKEGGMDSLQVAAGTRCWNDL